jgi:hypothetical protein
MSSPEQNTTEMTNPPKKQTKMVKIKAIYPIRVMDGKNEKIITEGSTCEVTEEEAKEFCDKEFNTGYRDVFGYSDPRAVKPVVAKRAVRL